MSDALICCPKEVGEISKRLMKALDGYESQPVNEISAFLLLAAGAACSIGVSKNGFMDNALELYETWDAKFSDIDE